MTQAQLARVVSGIVGFIGLSLFTGFVQNDIVGGGVSLNAAKDAAAFLGIFTIIGALAYCLIGDPRK